MGSSKLILVGWSFFFIFHCVHFSVLFVVLALNSGPRSRQVIVPPLSYVPRPCTKSMLFFFFGDYQRTADFNKKSKGSPLSKPLISFPVSELQPRLSMVVCAVNPITWRQRQGGSAEDNYRKVRS